MRCKLIRTFGGMMTGMDHLAVKAFEEERADLLPIGTFVAKQRSSIVVPSFSFGGLLFCLDVGASRHKSLFGYLTDHQDSFHIRIHPSRKPLPPTQPFKRTSHTTRPPSASPFNLPFPPRGCLFSQPQAFPTQHCTFAGMSYRTGTRISRRLWSSIR